MIIVIMIVTVLLIGVGYAAFGSNLTIGGTVNIASSWNVLFTKIEEVTKTSGTTIIFSPTVNGTDATFSAGFKKPGDKIVYNLTLSNRGTFDALIKEINAFETGSDALYFTITGIRKGDILKKESSKTITIEMGYDQAVTGQPLELVNELTVNIECEQNVGQSVIGEDLKIKGPILTNVTGTNRATLENSVGKYLQNYKIYGNTLLNGTPSPELPATMVSFGESKEVKADVHTNLYAFPEEVDVSFSNSYYSAFGTTYKLEPATTYTLSFDFSLVSSTATNIYCTVGYGRQNHYLRDMLPPINLRKNGQRTIGSFTTPNSFENIENYLSIRFARADSLATAVASVKNIQLEKGNVYYPRNSYTIDLSSHQPLRKVGDSIDYIDYKSKVIVRKNWQYSLTGSENWNCSNNSTGDSLNCYISNNKDGLVLLTGGNKVKNDSSILSTHFVNTNLGQTDYQNRSGNGIYGYSNDMAAFIITTNKVANTEEWKNYLKNQMSLGTPVKILYELSTPVYEFLSLPSIKTLETDSMFEVSSNIVSSNVEVSYYKDYKVK